MNRKLIFLDIDGTLVSALSSPSPLVQKAVRGARANGHLVFLCTGRNLPIISADILDLGFDGVIASAGAYVCVGDRILLDYVQPEEQIQQCLAVFHGLGMFCRIETREGIYMDSQMESLLRSADPDPRNSELIRMQKELEERLSVRDYAAYPRQGAYKVCFTAASPEALEKAREALEDRFAFAVHSFHRTGAFINGEIIPREVDKGRAMEMVCREFGAPLEDAIAFGDSMNDEPMLRRAGVGVAMDNACEELKALADVICEDVSEDGVYHELHRRGIC